MGWYLVLSLNISYTPDLLIQYASQNKSHIWNVNDGHMAWWNPSELTVVVLCYQTASKVTVRGNAAKRYVIHHATPEDLNQAGHREYDLITWSYIVHQQVVVQDAHHLIPLKHKRCNLPHFSFYQRIRGYIRLSWEMYAAQKSNKGSKQAIIGTPLRSSRSSTTSLPGRLATRLTFKRNLEATDLVPWDFVGAAR